MSFLGRFIRRESPQPNTQPDAQSFSQGDARETFLTIVGNRLLRDLDHHTQARICGIFSAQDVDGLKQLVEMYSTPTVEAISFALDDAVKGVIGEKSSYHGWAMGVLEGRGEQPQGR